MLFTEFSFIFIFLPLTLLVYYSMPSTRLAIGALVVASLIFYGAWNIYFVPMLLFAIISNYLIARELEKSGKDAWFWFGIILALIPLFYFKYSGLAATTAGLSIQTGFFGEKLGSVLPLGISFYTFQQILYLADVKAGKIKTAGLLEYAFFKLFFPQLIAGPIVHYRQLIPQIGQKIDLEKRFAEGAVYFAIGFAKKFFVADHFAAISDPIFDGSMPVDTQTALFATLGYTLQLYFDFSGYSDMATGLARLFGFELPWNFNSPYKAVSISDFWRRWHMTLSQFLRDYVYIPLGGNRRGEFQRYRNLFLTMLIGGLWHGAAWTFVLWGALHGLALAVNHLWERKTSLRLGFAGPALTFILVALLWVLFRATSFGRAMDIYAGFGKVGVFTANTDWLWLAGGLAACFLAPNSHAIVSWFGSSRLRPVNFSAAALSRRLGAFAILSSGLLFAAAAAFYSNPVDRWTYARIDAPADKLGITNQTGDYRSNLWRKDIFARPEKRIVLVGSSFSAMAGRYALIAADGEPPIAVTESLGMGGNGLIQGARAAAAVISSRSADVVVLAVSPLNFGTTLNAGAFPGECLDGYLTPELRQKYKLSEKPLGSCAPAPFQWTSLFQVFGSSRSQAAQFKNYLHNVLMSAVTNRNGFAPLKVGDDGIAQELAAIKSRLAALAEDKRPVGNPANGADKTFKWAGRQIPASLEPNAQADAVFAFLKRLADEKAVPFVVYETPTVKNSEAPDVYPAGFFEAYQSSLRALLARHGIAYLDLSDLAPWTGGAMSDFIHPQFEVREMIMKIVAAWLLQPEILGQSGLPGSDDVPVLQGVKEKLQ